MYDIKLCDQIHSKKLIFNNLTALNLSDFDSLTLLEISHREFDLDELFKIRTYFEIIPIF